MSDRICHTITQLTKPLLSSLTAAGETAAAAVTFPHQRIRTTMGSGTRFVFKNVDLKYTSDIFAF